MKGIGIIGRIGAGLAISGLVSVEGAAVGTKESEVPAVHRAVSGAVTIDETCVKTGFSDLRVLVSAMTATGYRRPQVVPLGSSGTFEVLLHQSYNYRFELMLKGEKVGGGRYEPRYPDKVPTLRAVCPKKEDGDGKKAAKAAH